MSVFFARFQGTLLILLGWAIALLGGVHDNILGLIVGAPIAMIGTSLFFFWGRRAHRPMPKKILGCDLSKY